MDEMSFAGYQRTEGGKLAKQSKVDWARSDWVHLNELCVREGVQIHIDPSVDMFVVLVTCDEDIQAKTSDSKVAYSLCKQNQLAKYASDWRDKRYQGRVVREATHVDHKLSNYFLSNHKLRDSLVSFIVRGRLQLLQCNSLMSLYYPLEYTQRCSLCNHPFDTTSHVLNGCTKYQRLYQARHNRILDVVVHNIPKTDNAMHSLTHAFTTTASRPDITIIHTNKREAFLVEFAVPFDAFNDRCHAEKFAKYMPLCIEINSLGYFCRVVVVVIGSLGTVHKKVVPGFQLLGISRSTSKWLAKYLSVSAAIGSHRVWQLRCNDMKV
jgi:hypothetical protein